MCWWLPYLIISLPIALIAHTKFKWAWSRSIFFSTSMTIVSWLFLGLFLDAIGVIDLSNATSDLSSIVISRANLSTTATRQPLSTIKPTISNSGIYVSTAQTIEGWSAQQTLTAEAKVAKTTLSPLEATLAFGFSYISTGPVDWENKYLERSCSFELDKEQYTSARCFALFSSKISTEGRVFYSGEKIIRIEVVYPIDTTQVTINRCAIFIDEVATSLKWNLDDLAGATTKVISAPEREWIINNSISAAHFKDDHFWYFSYVLYGE